LRVTNLLGNLRMRVMLGHFAVIAAGHYFRLELFHHSHNDLRQSRAVAAGNRSVALGAFTNSLEMHPT
jgi:hypothetical protein